MQIENLINDFVKTDVGGVMITDSSGKVVYAEETARLPEAMLDRFLARMPSPRAGQRRKTWELTDAGAGKYYRIVTSTFENDGELLQCHYLSDVTDFANLSKDISEYSRKLADVSDFQANILTIMSKPYDMFLPAVAGFCRSDAAALWMERKAEGIVARTLYNGEWVRENIPIDETTDSIFSITRFERRNGFRCILSDVTDDCRYVVALKESESMNEEYFKDISVYNIIRLFVENGILREKIIYESEHDRLTGLYNHEKYLDMLDKCFGKPKSLAIYMLTVGDLEYMNDHYGHIAGDTLIKKASDSLKSVLSDNILGFRLGGDKFAIVASNLTEEEAGELRDNWRRSLDDINKAGRIKCFISCGMAYGEGDYDPDKLMEQADVGMYREKRKLKEDLIRLALDSR